MRVKHTIKIKPLVPKDGGNAFTEFDMWKGVKTKEEEYLLSLIIEEGGKGWFTHQKRLHLVKIFTSNFPIEIK